MEDTYSLKAIILNRKSISECDGRIVVYSREFGKLELTARGAKKIKSKLAGHLEPISLTDIMAVRGRRHDYVGAAVSKNCFSNIKNDLKKLEQAAQAVKTVARLIKPGVADEKIFELLKNYLECLDASIAVSEVSANLFILKILAELGHRPELSVCVSCSKKIQPGKNRFDLARGGLVCGRCIKAGGANQLAIDDDSIKLLRLALEIDFSRLMKVKINKKLEKEIVEIVDKFFKYSFN